MWNHPLTCTNVKNSSISFVFGLDACVYIFFWIKSAAPYYILDTIIQIQHFFIIPDSWRHANDKIVQQFCLSFLFCHCTEIQMKLSYWQKFSTLSELLVSSQYFSDSMFLAVGCKVLQLSSILYLSIFRRKWIQTWFIKKNTILQNEWMNILTL